MGTRQHFEHPSLKGLLGQIDAFNPLHSLDLTVRLIIFRNDVRL